MLHSLRQQTWPQKKIEHLVVDGASDDGTLEYLQATLHAGNITALVSKPDSGIYEAMNRGIRHASGDAILFLNSDDTLEPQALEVLADALERSKASYAYADMLRVDDTGEVIGVHIGNIRTVYFQTPYCHQTLLYRRGCYDILRYDEHFKITEWPLCI